MILSDRYNIPAETVNKMIKDGVISCSWSTYEQVYTMRNDGKSISEIAYHTRMSERNVLYILKKMK